MSSVTGTVSSTVVTLSRKAENTAVTIDIISRMPHGPRVDLLRRPDRHVLEQTGAARDVDDQHHPEQEAERVPVDGGHRLLLVQHADEDQQARRPAARRSRG